MMRALAAILVVGALVGTGIALAAHKGGKPDKPPIIFVVFDALPGPMLEKPGGQLDAERYPGFAALASGATWYRNATTVHDSTVKSIPAMLDGRWPSNLRRPLVGDHPVNVFTLLRDSYSIWADEEGTQLCPRSVCRTKRARLLYLLHGRREQRFEAALTQIRVPARGDKPPLWFVHVLLPHEPLRFLPSGKVYESGSDPEPGLDGNESFDNDFLAEQAEQRHLLQLQYTDVLVQHLLARLRKTGLYDKALIVVTADHGISFRVKKTPAEPYRLGQIGWRRDLTEQNAHDVAFVPLFVKKPHQSEGVVDDSWARTIDILPTVLEQAQVERRPRAMIGQALGERRTRPRELPVVTNRLGSLTLDPVAMARKRDATVERRAAHFGVGAGVDQLFRIGPNPALIGRRITEFHGDTPSRVHARFWGARRYLAVNPGGRHIPANVIGWLDGRAPAGRDLAVAVNGKIAAVSRSFGPIGSLRLNFSLLVPESAFRRGFNDVRLYEVKDGTLADELGRSPLV